MSPSAPGPAASRPAPPRVGGAAADARRGPAGAAAHALAPRGGALEAGWPERIELVLVLAAIALLWPVFERIAGLGGGRDQRFAETALRIDGLPAPSLLAVCAAHGLQAESALREGLCGSAPWGLGREAAGAALPPALALASEAAARALMEPLRRAQQRLDSSRAPQREGQTDLRESAYAIDAVQAEIQPYLDRFGLGAADAAGPRPLACARAWIDAALAAPDRGPAAAVGRANALLLYAAALDGRPQAATLAEAAILPRASACGDAGSATLGSAAAVMEVARQSAVNARKDEASRALLQSAGLQWAAAMLLGYGFVVWSRRVPRPALGVAAALAAWAGAAWLARVPWPLADRRSFEAARDGLALDGWPAPFVVALAGAAALALLGSLRPRPSLQPAPPQAMSSRVGYPGLVLASGLGAVLLLELSAQGHPVNRYLALYHQGHLWLGLLLFSVLLFVRRPLTLALSRGLVAAGDWADARRGALTRRFGRRGAALLLAAAALAAVLLFGLALANLRQLTSELGRIWLIVGAAWFFFLRGGPLAERLARAGPAARSVGRYLAPLLVVVGVLVGAMLITRDMGPLLIAGYAGGAFVAASAAMWWHLRSGRRAGPLALAVLLFAAWIGAVTLALFELGSVDSVTAARLESLAAPLASTNDQSALVRWFQQATPSGGFGIGAVPWCGFVAAGRCAGVPAQIHSDYSFTAIVGVFGPAAAWAAAIAAAVWLHRLVRHHGRVTRGEPRFLRQGGAAVVDGQALASWITVAWVALTLCQLAVTVAGNLALLPLTGVTFPFVSFGMTSLVVNLAFLALAINVERPPPQSH